MQIKHYLLQLVGAMSLLAPLCAEAQGLAVSLPTDGSTYHPGDTIAVTVINPSGGPVSLGTSVHGAQIDPLLFTDGPYNFSIQIPKGESAGNYFISAITPGANASNPGARIRLRIEPDISAPNSTLTTGFTTTYFDFPGLTESIDDIYLSYGAVSTEVSNSSLLTSKVDDPTIASVNGVNITALAPGTTTVTLSVGSASTMVKVVVDKGSGVRGDLNGDGVVDLSDLAILQSALNTKTATPNDPRDLNHDGKIDALDARVLTTLCTYPRCAPRP